MSWAAPPLRRAPPSLGNLAVAERKIKIARSVPPPAILRKVRGLTLSQCNLGLRWPQLGKTRPMATKNDDRWLAAYIRFLEAEHRAQRGGPIGQHYLACAASSYQDWRTSGNPRARFNAWLAIRVTAQWLAQLERRAS